MGSQSYGLFPPVVWPVVRLVYNVNAVYIHIHIHSVYSVYIDIYDLNGIIYIYIYIYIYIVYVYIYNTCVYCIYMYKLKYIYIYIMQTIVGLAS